MTGQRKSVGAGPAVLLVAGLAESLARRDHPAAMAHCAQMREQVRQGGQVPPDMQRMQRTCDHMDHAMGAMRGRPPG